MAGRNKHHYRKLALHEYGSKYPNLSLDFNEIMIFINTYTNNIGRLHRHVNTNRQVIGNLLLGMPEFTKVKKGYWKYNKIEEEE